MLSKIEVEKVLGRPVLYSRVFSETPGDTFSAYAEASAFVEKLGLAMGSMQSSAPIGLALDADYISKWRNMSTADHKHLDGLMLSDDFREGRVWVYLTFEATK